MRSTTELQDTSLIGANRTIIRIRFAEWKRAPLSEGVSQHRAQLLSNGLKTFGVGSSLSSLTTTDSSTSTESTMAVNNTVRPDANQASKGKQAASGGATEFKTVVKGKGGKNKNAPEGSAAGIEAEIALLRQSFLSRAS